MENYFNELNSVNVSEHIEKKGKLSYLSWVYAWGEIKKRYPNANYVVYENSLPGGYNVNYFTDGRTAYVKVGVIVNDICHIEMLPIMDNYNKSIPLEKITSFDVNTSIQRALTKAIARHGLGLYIYAGEDLPQDEKQEAQATQVVADKPLPKPQNTIGTSGTYGGMTHEELVVACQTSYNLLDNDKKERWNEYFAKKGWGTDFNEMPNEALSVVLKGFSRSN